MTTASTTALVPRLSTADEAREVARCYADSIAPGTIERDRASELFALSGASAADEKYDLSRHWRNARTHASHDPVDWKYHHAGNYLLNSVAPPNHGPI